MDALFNEAVIKQLLVMLETASIMGGIAAIVYFVIPLIMSLSFYIAVFYTIRIILRECKEAIVKVRGDKNDPAALANRLQAENDAAIDLEKRKLEDAVLARLRAVINSQYQEEALIKLIAEKDSSVVTFADASNYLHRMYFDAR